MVSGIILAAGPSKRMGTPKAILKFGNETFVEHIVHALNSARITDIVVVLGSEAETIRKSMTLSTGKIVVNDRWSEGQLSSLIAGLDAIEREDVNAALVCPADHPLVSQEIIVGLLTAYWKSNKKIIVPTFEGRRGHPVIFDKSLFAEIRLAPPDVGAREVVRNHTNEIAEVPVDTDRVLKNIDTPEEYASMTAESLK